MPSHTNLSSLYPLQRERLRAFRDTASDLYRALGEETGRRISTRDGERLTETQLRPASAPIRLTLLPSERAYFPGVVEVLELLHDRDVSSEVRAIERAWRTTEAGHVYFIVNDGDPRGGKAIRDAWLFGRYRHHGENHEATRKALEEMGKTAVFALQIALVSHARLMLFLDAVIARVLDEPMVWERYSPGEERFFCA